MINMVLMSKKKQKDKHKQSGIVKMRTCKRSEKNRYEVNFSSIVVL